MVHRALIAQKPQALASTHPHAMDASATLDDLCEAVETFADAERIAQRMLGVGHPLTAAIELDLRKSRDALRARAMPQENVIRVGDIGITLPRSA